MNDIEHPTVTDLIVRLHELCDSCGMTIPETFKALERGEYSGTILQSEISMLLFLLGAGPERYFHKDESKL